jgi:hypothetical protein
MAWINSVFCEVHPLVVVLLVLSLAWGISSLVERRKLRPNSSGEYFRAPAPSLSFQHSRLTRLSTVGLGERPQGPLHPNDAKGLVAESETRPTPSDPISIPHPANNGMLPVIVLPWRSSFSLSLSPRSTFVVGSSADGRKGSLCPLHLDNLVGGVVPADQASPDSDLAGIGGQFTAPKVQAQNRQLSFS